MVARALILGLALVGLSLAGEPRIAWVRPHGFVSSDDLVDYQIRIDPHPENRIAIFSAVDQEDGNEVRRSREDLPGENAPRTRWLRWRLPKGSLLLVAALYGVNGQITVAKTPVKVRGRYDEPEEP